MNRDLSLRGILSEWVREVVGIEGRLPRTLRKLFAHPGFLTRATLKGERDSYLSALSCTGGEPGRHSPVSTRPSFQIGYSGNTWFTQPILLRGLFS